MLCQKNKFFCDSCCDLQEAEKRFNFPIHPTCFTTSLTVVHYRMKIKKLPNVLALHLKRFKYQEDVARYIKLAYRVAFPYELRLFNTVDDMDNPDRLYYLFAIVVHVGRYVSSLLFLVLCHSCSSSGPHHGHYISIIKTAGTWLVFDDDNVYPIPENDIPKYFGDSSPGSAYVLYYQAIDIDLVSLGLRRLEPSPETITDLMPPVQPFPLQNQTLVPALPPGLNSCSAVSLGDDVDLAPPTTPSPVLHHFEPEAVVTPLTPMPQSRELLTAIPAGTSSPMSSGFGTKLINTIRRAPSMSGTRGIIGAPSGSVGERRSTVEKGPSLSIPSGESLHELPPPLPPLPSGILTRSDPLLNGTPIPNAQVIDPKKEKEKEKDKTKLTKGGWFNRKRKSLRLGEKSRPESGVPDPYPSPVIKGDERGLYASFPPITTPVLSDPNGPRPDNLRSEKSDRDSRLNGCFRKSPPEPTSLFSGSFWNFTDSPSTPVRPSHTRSRSSLSDMGSNAQPDFPSSGKPSFSPSSDRDRPVDGRRSVDSRPLSSSYGSRPMTAPSSTSPMASDYTSTLPPPPPTPRAHYHRTNLSWNNGQVFYKEPQNTATGKTKSPDVDDSSVSDKPSYSEPPASMATSVGQNSSVGSVNSATSNIKGTTRKLSLGFGKRDKGTDRERDRVAKQ